MNAASGRLGQKAASGFFWLFLQTLAQKAIGGGGQIILAWLLLPSDFGLVGLALTVSAFITLLQQTGVKDVLIRRHESFDQWVSPAFWLVMISGVLAMGLHIVVAPVGSILFHKAGLTGPIMVLGLVCPFNAMIAIAQARLRIDMRFRVLASVGLATNVIILLLSFLLAWYGFGVYSIIIPRVAGAAFQAICLWRIAAPDVRWDHNMSRWWSLLNDSGMLFLASVFSTIVSQGDYATLGLFQTETVVGIYYFAFNLSMQTMGLFTVQLWDVLVPVLSHLQGNRGHQTQAFLKGARLLAMICVPLTLLQAALADPIIRMIFNAKWIPSIPVLMFLSIGMSFYAVGAPAGGLMAAQGRFRTIMWLSFFSAVGFIVMLVCGALMPRYFPGIGQPATIMGAVVAVYYGVTGAMTIRVAIRNDAKGWSDVWRVYAPSFIASAIALGPLTWVCFFVTQDTPWRNIIRISSVIGLGMPIYILLLRILAPADWLEMRQRVTHFVGRKLAIGGVQA